jgi:hypothetical protein
LLSTFPLRIDVLLHQIGSKQDEYANWKHGLQGADDFFLNG